MIRLPGHEVDRGRMPSGPALDGVPGHDLALASDRVAVWGGHPAWFRSRLGAALAIAPGLAGADFTAASAIAAWRSGVLGLRDDALASAPGMVMTHGPAAVGALLDLRADHVEQFLTDQRRDRLAWPPWRDLGRAFVAARIGGFVGLGGVWRRPPTDVTPIGDGAWIVATGEELWRLDADLFGHVLAPAHGDLPRDGHTSRNAPRLTTSPNSYLVTLVGGSG